MSDFRMPTGWRTHPKRKKLRRRHGAEGVLALMDLWAWCADHPDKRSTGSLEGMDAEDIAIAGDLPDDINPEDWVRSLTELGLLDENADGELFIHDWCSWQPYLAGSEERSEQARVGAFIRHHKAGRHHKKKDGCPLCAGRMQNPADSTKNLADSTADLQRQHEKTTNLAAPDPSPSPSPSPDPDPSPIPFPAPDPKTLVSEKIPIEPEPPPAAAQPKASLAVFEDPPPALEKPPPSAPSPIRAVFEHYRFYHPKRHRRPSPKSKEWRAIKARLEEGYTVEDLKQAIDGNHRSPWHSGENPGGKKYQSLELIMRDGSKVGQFLELAESPEEPVLSEKTRRGIRAGRSWANRMRSREDNHAST